MAATIREIRQPARMIGKPGGKPQPAILPPPETPDALTRTVPGNTDRQDCHIGSGIGYSTIKEKNRYSYYTPA